MRFERKYDGESKWTEVSEDVVYSLFCHYFDHVEVAIADLRQGSVLRAHNGQYRIAGMVRDVDIIKAAYVTLLAQGIFPGRATMEGQALLAAMRDAIARAEGSDGEDVQRECENMARSRIDVFNTVRQIVRDVGILKQEGDG